MILYTGDLLLREGVEKTKDIIEVTGAGFL
jgi:hypothetical protein